MIVEPPHLEKYNYIELPGRDSWGAVMKADHPLAAKKAISVEDLADEDLICSEQSITADLPRWCGDKIQSLNFIGTSNLAYNGVRCVEEGLGIMLTFRYMNDSGVRTPLCWRPLTPPLENKMYMIWKKYQVFTPIAERFKETFL